MQQRRMRLKQKLEPLDFDDLLFMAFVIYGMRFRTLLRRIVGARPVRTPMASKYRARYAGDDTGPLPR